MLDGKQLHVGIVSKPSHAKAHAERLKKEGYSVELLGGKPSRLPTRCDVIVCRVSSSSHAGFDLANAARKRGRVVIFEDGMTGIMQSLNAMNRRMQVGVDVGLTEDRSPICGEHYRAYFNARDGKWFLRTGPGWKKSVRGVRTKSRDDAITLVSQMDAHFRRLGHLPPTKVTEETPVRHEEKVVSAELNTDPPRKDELTEWAEGLLEEMKSRKLFTFNLGNMKVTIEATHLSSPSGVACGAEGGNTLVLADVDCPHCLASEQYKLMAWLNDKKESAT